MSAHLPAHLPRRLAAAGATAALALTGLSATALSSPAGAAPQEPQAPRAAAAGSYVALGDSYSSGTGTESYLDDGTSCQRSTLAYPSLIAAQQGYSLNLRACAGAVTSDVTATQLGALSASTSYVTISIGGNDAGFTDVLTECALPGWMSDCDGAIDGAQAFIATRLPGRLSSLYAAIRTGAPNARVVTVGYPRIFMGEDCNAATFFSPEEEARLNTTADQINSRISAAASAKGFGFADPTSRFVGHAVCDAPEWLNGLSSPISESYHPNRLGHSQGYTPLVGPSLSGRAARAGRVGRATIAKARASSGAQTRLQKRYAKADRQIRPQRFRTPDLTSPRARRAAKAHGINLERWVRRHR